MNMAAKQYVGILGSTHNDRQAGQSLLEQSSITIYHMMKQGRDRSWEHKNPARAYFIPRYIWNAARQVRDDILWIAHYDENGRPREDLTTVNGVASILMGWALKRAEEDPSILKFSPNTRWRGHQLMMASNLYAGGTAQLSMPEQNIKSGDTDKRDFVIAYRWTLPELDQRIRKLAGKGVAKNPKKRNPSTYAVPLGMVVICLLQLALNDYKARRFRLKTEPVSVVQMALDWEVWISE